MMMFVHEHVLLFISGIWYARNNQAPDAAWPFAWARTLHVDNWDPWAQLVILVTPPCSRNWTNPDSLTAGLILINEVLTEGNVMQEFYSTPLNKWSFESRRALPFL